MRWLYWLLGVWWTVSACAKVFVSERHRLPFPGTQPSAVLATEHGVYALDLEGRLWRVAPGKALVVTQGMSGALGLGAGEGGIWIADPVGSRVFKTDLQGKTLRQIKLTESEHPVVVIEGEGRLFWAEREHRLCWQILSSGERQCFGERGKQPGQFDFPGQMALDRDGFLWVTDILNGRVQVFAKDGRFFGQVGRFGFGSGELFRPVGLAIDPSRDLVFVSDGYFGTISVFQGAAFLGLVEDEQGPLRLQSPTGLSYHNGRLYVADTGGNAIWQLQLTVVGEEAIFRPQAVSPHLAQKDCLLCHLEWAKVSESTRAPDGAGILPVGSLAMCYSCHNGPIMDSRAIIADGAQHPTVYERPEEKARHQRQGQRQDEIPELFALARPSALALSCANCHTPHTNSDGQVLYAGHRNAWLRVPNRDGDLCERCHASRGKGTRQAHLGHPHSGKNHPLGIALSSPPHPEASGYPSDPELQHGLPEVLKRKGAALDSQGRLICQTCHQIHGGYGEAQLTVLPTEALCTACHRRQASQSKQEARRKGVHPIGVELDEPVTLGGETINKVTCSSCHRVHDGTPGTSLLPAGIQQASALCQNCHKRQHAEGKDDARHKHVHPVNLKLEKAVEVAGKKRETLDCLSCHAVHAGKPNTPALVEEHREGELCRPCHEKHLLVVGSDHDLRITAKDSRNHFEQSPQEAGVCGSCHTMHRGKELGEMFLSAVRRVGHPEQPVEGRGHRTEFQRDKLCLNCHQDHPQALARKKVVEAFSHPYQQIILQSKELPLLQPNGNTADVGAIGCITCHDPHVWKPGDSTRHRENQEGDAQSSFLRQSRPEKTFCLSCHGFAVRLKFLYFHDPKLVRHKLEDLK